MEEDSSLDVRRRAKRNGEEDPLVVAQRFLNIYRQMHVFNDERKAAFNQMVLELSPEIRGIFGQLPGGILLQEYVDELAEQKGIATSVHIQKETAQQEDADSKQAKILANALAQAQVQASAQMQTMGITPTAVSAAPAQLSMDKDFAKEFATALGSVLAQNTTPQPSGDIKGIIESLGKGQIEILKNMQSENMDHREEMKKISMAMLQMQQRSSNSTPSPQAESGQPIIQQVSGDLSPDTKHMLEVLLNNQNQVMEKVAKLELQSSVAPVVTTAAVASHDTTAPKVQNEAGLEKIVSLLYEGQKNTTLEISKLINENQQNMMKLMVQNNTSNQNSGNASAANNIQINSSDYSAVLNSIADKLGNLSRPAANIEVKFPPQAFGDIIKAQSQLYSEIASRQTRELSSVIANALKESQQVSTQNIINSLRSQQQPFINSAINALQCFVDNLKLQNQVPTSEHSSVQDAAYSRLQYNNLENVFEESPKQYYQSNNSVAEPSLEDVFSNNNFEVSQNQNADFNTGDETDYFSTSTVSEKKKKKKKKKKNNDANYNNIETTESLKQIFEDTPNIETDDSISLDEVIDTKSNFSFFDDNSNDEENTQDQFDDISYNEQNLLSQSDEEILPESENISFFDTSDEETQESTFIEEEDNNVADDVFTEEETQDDFVSESVQEEFLDNSEYEESNGTDTANDWGFGTEEESPSETITTSSSYETADDWGFGSGSTTSEETTNSESEFGNADDNEESGEGVDWEWEYIEEDEEGFSDNDTNNMELLGKGSSIYTGEMPITENMLSQQEETQLPEFEQNPLVKDSFDEDPEENDPYQNSDI